MGWTQKGQVGNVPDRIHGMDPKGQVGNALGTEFTGMDPKGTGRKCSRHRIHGMDPKGTGRKCSRHRIHGMDPKGTGRRCSRHRIHEWTQKGQVGNALGTEFTGMDPKGTGRKCSRQNPWDGPRRDRQEMLQAQNQGTPLPGELAVPSKPPLLFVLTKMPVRSFSQAMHPSQGLPAQLNPSCRIIGMGIQHFTLIWEVIISAFTRDDGPIMQRKLIRRGEEKLMSCSGATRVPLWLFQTLWAHRGEGRSCSNISIKTWTVQLLSRSTAMGQGALAKEHFTCMEVKVKFSFLLPFLGHIFLSNSGI
ncbi:uncharacterized protein LOC131089171 [Melospiza georgiana]|uniref:uncharacterized protein LOC131089171 n=1 Tax=Melospiza georgiana TaxID=44398 RepID=UPI0025AC10EF|nr:uncharacterized protein LOC131089171 [Melospiza georgiana]